MDRLKKITPFILLIVVLGLNTYLHLFPAYFPQLKKQAKLNIENQAFRQASQFVQHKYPNFNRLLQEKIIKGIVKDGKAKQRFRDAIEKEYQRLKGPYQDEDGQTYFLEVDPYCRLRFTRLVLENGYPGNKKIDGEVYDTFMLAPKGSPVPPPRFLYYCSAYLYKVYSLVFPQVSLEKFLFYLPLFFTLIFFISLFLFCRYFFSSMSGVLAVFFIGLSPVFIHRSCVGWFDQDALNVLFPILIVWCLGLSLEKKTFISIAKYSLLASLLLGLYAFSWIGWWFILAVIIIFFASSLANHFCLYFKDKATLIEKSFPYLVSSGLFLAGSVIFCLLIAKTEPFSFLIYSLGKNLQLGSSSSSSIWPSVLYTVSELKGGNPKTIPIYTGGWTIFMLSLFSLLGIYLSNRRSKKADIVLLLSYWAFVMFFASLKGLRFTQFLFVPLGIFLGVGLTQIWQLFPSGLRYLKNRKQKIAVTIVAISLVCALLSIPIQRGISQASVQFPIVNDGWYNLMLKIKQETPKNSVINSWWDYGNWFKEIAQRATIVDPQIQDVPVTHWMARVFLTDNEEEAVRILRMINNSSDKLFDEIRSFLGDDFTTIAFLNRILKLKLSEVEPVLKAYRIPKGLAHKIKDAVFIKNPAPSYLFIDSGMI